MQFEEFFHDIIITMHENIRDPEDKKAFADAEEKDHESGRIFSYSIVLEIMRESARRLGVNGRESGL